MYKHDILTPISGLSTLQELQALYKQDWPKHCVGYYWLDNFIRWLKIDPDLKHLQFLTLNDDWRSEGFFLIIHRYQLFFSALQESAAENIAKALRLLDWSNGFKISSVLDWSREPLMKVIEEKQVQLDHDRKSTLFYMSSEDALKLEINCPPGYYLKELAISEAATIDTVWPARHQGSLQLIRLLIERNANIGIYVSETHELAAWCLRIQGGFLSALQVQPAHKRRGLGSVAVCAISKRIAFEYGHDIMALVYLENKVASSLFKKLGFHATGEQYSWLLSSVTTGGTPWPENI